MILLSPKEIKEKLPLDDGYSYYMSFGDAIAKAQLKKVVEWLKAEGYWGLLDAEERQALLEEVKEG